MICCNKSEYGLFLSSVIFIFVIADLLLNLCGRPLHGLCLGVAGLGGPCRRPHRGCFLAQHTVSIGSRPSVRAFRPQTNSVFTKHQSRAAAVTLVPENVSGVSSEMYVCNGVSLCVDVMQKGPTT